MTMFTRWWTIARGGSFLSSGIKRPAALAGAAATITSRTVKARGMGHLVSEGSGIPQQYKRIRRPPALQIGREGGPCYGRVTDPIRENPVQRDAPADPETHAPQSATPSVNGERRGVSPTCVGPGGALARAPHTSG